MSKTDPRPEDYQRAMEWRGSVLQVVVKTLYGPSTGTGFVIKEGRNLTSPALVLTCQHVVTPTIDGTAVPRLAVHIRKAMPGGGVKEMDATVVNEDAEADIALLSVPGLSDDTPGLTFSPNVPGNIGEGAILTGYCNPHGLFTESACARLPALSPGFVKAPGVSTIKTSGEVPVMRVYLDCLSSMTGCSGGPVVTGDGVIGMLTHKSADGKTKMALPSYTIVQMLRSWANLPINGDSTLEEVLERFQ